MPTTPIWVYSSKQIIPDTRKENRTIQITLFCPLGIDLWLSVVYNLSGVNWEVNANARTLRD